MGIREYETVFITQPNLPESQHKQMVERFGSIIERHEGRLFYARNMGKRTLAYPINKQIKGLYTCMDYASGGGAVGEIERNMRIDENVLRFLTVVKAEEVDVEARAAEIVAKGEDAQPAPAEDGAVEAPAEGEKKDAGDRKAEARAEESAGGSGKAEPDSSKAADAGNATEKEGV
ncbi:MAG TPA: 30S ribosomal protein S6 [bacterium]|nr:30S ribosomal protein S6 [bacterium]